LSSNIRDRRKKLGISQEKLAEMTDLSVQMVNSIEGHRVWVSDKTLVAISKALGIEVSQLFTPSIDIQKKDRSQLLSFWLMQIQQDIKEDINADVDTHFERLINLNITE
jgi:transcriptional regulator with XRE-family HTH domain